MIDLHSHILPGVDDGAGDIATALLMARMAVDDGISTLACTPHFMPGLYNNEVATIARKVAELQQALVENDIPLKLIMGGDVHIRADLVAGLRAGTVPCLQGTHYFLLEPPHVVLPPHFEKFVKQLVQAGFVPIITHPERLSWIEQEFGILRNLVLAGAWMQVTAGSLTGRFGKRPQYWAQRLLQNGLVHILASDAHNVGSRPPRMAHAVAIAAREVGHMEAQNLVVTRPRFILQYQRHHASAVPKFAVGQ
jgi:protein-tyrosine phosphatase